MLYTRSLPVSDAACVAEMGSFNVGGCNLVATLPSVEEAKVFSQNPQVEATTSDPVLSQTKWQSTKEMQGLSREPGDVAAISEAKEQDVLEGPTLTAEQCVRPKQRLTPQSVLPVAVAESQEASQAKGTLENATTDVSGIPPGLHEDFLSLFFSSSDKSGGGEIKDLQCSEDEGTARIEFKQSKGMSFKEFHHLY